MHHDHLIPNGLVKLPTFHASSDFAEIAARGWLIKENSFETAEFLNEKYNIEIFVDADQFQIGDTWTFTAKRGEFVENGRTGSFVVTDTYETYASQEHGKVSVYLTPTSLLDYVDKKYADYLRMTNVKRISALEAFNLDDKKQKAKKERRTASALGGSALTGSVKQKAWAEELRSDFLKSVTPEFRQRVLQSKASQSSTWWIENRKQLLSAASGLNTQF
jgi:hypothetical protein